MKNNRQQSNRNRIKNREEGGGKKERETDKKNKFSKPMETERGMEGKAECRHVSECVCAGVLVDHRDRKSKEQDVG